VSIAFYFATKRRRDLDNQNKLILDALTGIAYDDDSQIAELHLYRAYDAKRPRIEISLEKKSGQKA
jgi:Holliday junction resolvase RusA-like endonuclease